MANRRTMIAREISADSYVPYVHHASREVILLDDGSRLAMFSVDGFAWETADPDLVARYHAQLSLLWQNIADDRLTVSVHVVRREGDAADYPAGEFSSAWAQELDRAYRVRTLERLYANEMFLAVVLRPAVPSKAAGVTAWVNRMRRDRARGVEGESAQQMMDRLEDTCRVIRAALEPYGVQRLGVRQVGPVLYSEMAEALALLLTGRRRPVPLPLATCRLSRLVHTDRVVFEWDGLRIRSEEGVTYAAVLGMREYPAVTWSGQLSHMLSAPYFFSLSQTFGFLSKPDAMSVVTRKQNQMMSAQDRAYSQREALTEAADQLAGNQFVMGSHHLALTVFADSRDRLAIVAAQARADLADSGPVVTREDLGVEAAYWAQLPGNAWLRTRPGAISSRNWAALAPLHGYPRGAAEGYWGGPAALLRTGGGTAYRYHLHVGDVGNTALFGPTGSGKSTLMLFLLAQAGRAGARVVLFDKDRGAEIAARALGGTYLTMPIGRGTGLAPLRGLDGTPENIAFLARWVGGLITAGGYRLTPDDERRIGQGVRAMMRLPAEHRSLGELRAFLGQSDQAGAGARLDRWCHGGPLGWAFDGPEDKLSLTAPFIGFDMTAVLDDPDVRGPMMNYLFHRIEALVDGRRLIIAIDEFWKALLDPAFRDKVHDQLKTFRKRNAPVILATQSPRDALNSSIAHTLIEQCATKILLPAPSADREDYVGGLKLTEPEYRLIKETLTVGGRRFLLRQGVQSVACELDLTGMDDVIAVLSGRESTVRVLDQVMRERPDDWLPEFQARIKEAAA